MECGEWSLKQLRELEVKCRAFASIKTSSTATAVPLPHKARLRTSYKGTLRVGIAPFRIAASEALPPGTGMPDTLWGGLEGAPLRTIKGADTGFRRTNGIHPRRASAQGSGLR